MAEIRRDAISGRWVIIATERGSRPQDFRLGRGEQKGGFCPFCEGNEDRTPEEIWAIRPASDRPNSPGWLVRVVPNKYPALQLDGGVRRATAGYHQVMEGVGAHEVIIESPRHLISPTQMAASDFSHVMRAYCERSKALSRRDELAYILIFKNVGEAAGASIEHGHSQLIAVPVMPKRVQEEMRRCEDFYSYKGRCIFCEMIDEELGTGERIVALSDHFVALSPYAARFPFEMWVLPKFHSWHHHELEDSQWDELAAVLQEALGRLEICLNDPAYNYIIHTAPVAGVDASYYHWHIELIPRVTRVAGFEWGTGFYINPMEPERASQFLREVSEGQLRKKINSVPVAEMSDE